MKKRREDIEQIATLVVERLRRLPWRSWQLRGGTFRAPSAPATCALNPSLELRLRPACHMRTEALRAVIRQLT